MHPLTFLGLRVRGVRNDLRFGRGRGVLRAVFLCVIVASWLITVAATMGRVLHQVFAGLEASAHGDPTALAAAREVETAILALALNLQILLAMLLDAGPAAAFLSAELERVLVAPVEPRQIALAKLVENVPASLGIVAPLVGATVGAYALARGAGPAGAAAGILAILAIAVLGTGLAGAAAVALARALPRRFVRLALETGAALIGTLGYFVVNVFHQGERLTAALSRAVGGGPGTAGAPGAASDGGAARVLDWLPGGILARGLAAVADHRPLVALAAFAAVAAVAILVVAGAARLAAGLYAGGWTLAETSPTVRRRRRAMRPAVTAGVPSFYRAEIAKDVRLLLRSPELLLPTLGLLLAFFLPFVMRGGLGPVSGSAPFLVGAVCCGSLLVALDLGARVVPLDQLAFWRSKVAPVPGRRLAVAKHLSAVLAATPVAVAGTAALGVVAGLRPAAVAVQAVLALAAVWTGAAIGVALGAQFANFDWEHRNRMLRLPGQWLMALVVLPLVIVLVLAALVGRAAAASVGARGPVLLALLLGVGAVLAAVLAEAFLRVAARRFDGLEQTA